MIKQIQFYGKDEKGNVLCQPVWGDSLDGFEKQADAEWKGSNLHPSVRKLIKNGLLKSTDKGVYVLVNALGASEYWGSNVNGDAFPEASLTHAPPNWESLTPEGMKKAAEGWKYGFPTFMHAYPFKHHVNKDPSRAFGEVVLAVWNPKMKRVELVVFLDRAKAKKHGAEDVLDRIDRGEFPDVSMGCKVPYDRCSICGNKSKTKKDYCEHARMMMNKILPDGRKVCVINDYPRFFDISFVFIGADKSAKMLAKLSHVSNMQCMGDFCAVPQLSVKVAEEFSSGISDEPDVYTAQDVVEYIQQFTKTAELSEREIEDHAEQAYWEFDAARAKNGMERDAFKGQVRRALRKEANDPIKKKLEVQGVPIWIEWPKGSHREYKDKKGVVKYSKHMEADYGYIPNTKDSDGEEIDVYVGPDRESKTAYVVKQLKANGKDFDENKVMIGFSSQKKARDSYDHHMGTAKERFGGIKAVPVSALTTLFGENGDGKEKAAHSCECQGSCGFCEDSFAKIAEAFGQKSASHGKLGEIIKMVPAGPYRKAHLPKMEGKIPKKTLNNMAKKAMDAALSTPAMMGIVLRPEEFQRIMLVKIGEAELADSLDEAGIVFAQGQEEDDTFALDPSAEDADIRQELLPLMAERSIAQPILEKRASKLWNKQPIPELSTAPGDALLDKIAALYLGYRSSLVKKASAIEQSLASNPHLLPAVASGSMVEAFAGGIVKTAASVLGPESLAYLKGAHLETSTPSAQQAQWVEAEA